jgi:autotransporter-associated beta strand protein
MRIRSNAKINLAALAFVAFAVAMIGQASAADRTWNVATGAWTSTSSWLEGVVPSTTDNVILSNGGTATISATTTIGTLASAGVASTVGTINGALIVTGLVTKSGDGTLVLNGTTASKYTGGVTVNAGTLDISLWTSSAGSTTVASNATLNLRFSSGTTTKTWGSTTAGTLIGSGTINTFGLIRFNINGKTSFTGTTNVQSGCLYLGSGTTEGGVGGPLNIASDARVEINTGTPTTRNQTTANNITNWGTISKINAGTETFTGNSTSYGDIEVEGPLTLSGILQLDIANGGECANFKQYLRTVDPVVLYQGNVAFDGAIKLDVTDVTDAAGSWVLVNPDLLKSFSNNFSLALSTGETFSDSDNDNVWTCQAGGKSWSFAESNATLSVVPEPSSIVLLTLGLLGVAAYLRRRS